MTEHNFIYDDAGFPMIVTDEWLADKRGHKRSPAAALAQAPVTSPAILVDHRRILTLRQCSEVLGVDPDTATIILGRESVPRTVGWDAEAIVSLAEHLRADVAMRAELGLKP